MAKDDTVGGKLVNACTALMDAADACFTKEEPIILVNSGNMVGLLPAELNDLRDTVIQYRKAMVEVNAIFDKPEEPR